jgi:hypothetical protein
MAKNPQSKLTITCPDCGHTFSAETALETDLRLHLEKEFETKLTESSKSLEQRIRKQEEEKFKSRLKALEEDRLEKTERLQELEEKSVAMEEQEQKLKAREAKMELELRKRVLASEKVIQEKAEKKASEKAKLDIREKEQELEGMKEAMALTVKKLVMDETEKVRVAERMKAADIQKKLDDQTRLVNEMKRKSDQGSMQAQGEVQELAIEDYLKNMFLRDEVEEISKGKRGGDCIHIVKDGFGNVCGKILYESKRTKNFGGDWISKLKEDMRLTQADMGALVTEVLPSGMTHFGQVDGVWICTFAEFKALSFLLCDTLNRIGEVRAAQENQGDKMQLLYHYLTGNEFRQKLEAIVESFQQMQEDLSKEKAQTMSRWSKREKQIYKVMENTVSLYGDVRGIAGTAVKEIEALEMDEVKLLIGK